MNRKHINVLIVVLFVLLTGALVLSVLEYRRLENSLPYLLPGDEPEFNFELVDSAGYRFKGEIFKKKTVLLFIYRDSDRTTDNWLIWSSIAELASDLEVKSYGLILNEGFDRFYYALEKMDKDQWFKVFAPVHRSRFTDCFRIKYNLSQTLVVDNGIVKMVKFGKLLDEDYEDIMKLIRDLSQE